MERRPPKMIHAVRITTAMPLIQVGTPVGASLHGTGDGIGLHRVEDETEGDDQEDREQVPIQRAQALLHVVGRAATELALVVANLEQLGQVASTKPVTIPTRAIAHIQNTAPDRRA